MLTLTPSYLRETLYSIWSAGHYFSDLTFQLTARIFTWPGGSIPFERLNNSQLLLYLRRRHPLTPILVEQFNVSYINGITQAMTHRYHILVVARLTLAFFIKTDFILSIDSDTGVMGNPFPALAKEIEDHPNAVLFGVQDVAARGDGVFMNLLKDFDVSWSHYQQAAVIMLRTGEVVNAEIRRVYKEWAKINVRLHFAEQDALAIWFSSELKGMMNNSLNRQWADCGVNRIDNVVRLICHGRWGVGATWPIWDREMEKAKIQHVNDLCS
jgi:lipopolysaccharide biosynthesis glycosyltransferase